MSTACIFLEKMVGIVTWPLANHVQLSIPMSRSLFQNHLNLSVVLYCARDTPLSRSR
uniref:Uncharacterized protein n=1 Tax=Arundo donax TaxID=35708 RepID=A0A0A8YGT9_ARUDO